MIGKIDIWGLTLTLLMLMSVALRVFIIRYTLRDACKTEGNLQNPEAIEVLSTLTHFTSLQSRRVIFQQSKRAWRSVLDA